MIDIRRRDVRELVEAIARKRDAPIMANRTLGVLSRMFNFALDREWIEASPAARIREPGEEQSRDRVLSDDELRELWAEPRFPGEAVEPADDEDAQDRWREETAYHARDRAGVPGAAPDRAAARRGPIDALGGRDLESGWWSIPATVAKNGKAHRVPLTKGVVEILKARRESASEGASSCSRTVPARVPSRTAARRRRRCCRRSLTFKFRAHDLRRTAATRMAEAGVPRDHIAKVLNHVEGGPAATRVYDRYNYDAEKRDALDRWARGLAAIIEGKTKKVVAFRA